MRVSSIRLHPFAGIEDQRYDFDEGLNVLLGPNEAGKSTVFLAVMHSLLTSTSLTRMKVEDEMGRHFPAIGGDVIRVDLKLAGSNGETVAIQKTWKKGNRNGSASLKLADGTEITDEDEVQNQIEALLPVSPATLRTIMFGNQSGLHRTLQEMKQEDRVRKELGNLLRKNFMDTGGISVDRFRELLDQKYEDYFKRWDRKQQYPDNNKGIKNPYKVGKGIVLEAFYEKEQLRIDLEEARCFEDELDMLNEKLNTLINRQEEKKLTFEELNPLKEGIRQRQLKDQQLDAATERRTRLLEVSKKWPVYEDKISNLEPNFEQKNTQIQELEKEQKQAQNKVKAEQLKKQINTIEQLSQRVEEAQKEINEAKRVTQEDLKKLRGLNSDIRQFKTQIQAAKLTLHIESDSEHTIYYTEAGGEQQEVHAKGGSPIDRTAEGGFTLKVDDLSFQVFSGEGDLEQAVKDLETKESEQVDYLKELEVRSLQDAETQAELYRQKQHDLKQAKENYETELGDKELKDLKEEHKGYGYLSEVRLAEQITEDIVNAKTELNQLNQEAKEAKTKLGEWEEKYGSSDELLLELADTTSSIKKLQKELEELPSLPEGYDSSEAFIEEVNQLDQLIQRLKEQIFEKKQERTHLEAEAPDTSSEELQKLLVDAEAEFERINSQAETLARVREKALDLIGSMDSDTYKGLESSFVKWLALMIGERFAVKMDDDLPAAFTTPNAASLSFDILSHGTKDTVALAWRFALCEKFLTDESGFIILDDPMVDIDPDRRKEVTKAINQFAEEYQTIVMTCHPDHAEELGGEYRRVGESTMKM
jgi:exonuclease SbcC